MGTENKKTRRMLYRWGHTREEIRSIEDMVRETEDVYKAAFDTMKSPTLTGMPHAGGASDAVSRGVERAEREYERLEKARETGRHRIEDALEFRSAMDEVIFDLPETQRKIVRMRYQDDRPWRFIAETLYYSEDMVRYHDREAVRFVESRINVH